MVSFSLLMQIFATEDTTRQFVPRRYLNKSPEPMLVATGKQASNREIEIYNVVISSLTGEFQLRTEVTKVDRGTLLSLENPRYKELVERYNHLKKVTMDDVDEKEELPVHLLSEHTNTCRYVHQEFRKVIRAQCILG